MVPQKQAGSNETISSTCFNMASKVFLMLFLYLGLFIHFIYAVPERGIKEMVFDVVMLSFIEFV